MNGFCLWIGRVFCVIGGTAIVVIILGCVIYYAQYLWDTVLWRFGAISKVKEKFTRFIENEKSFSLYLEDREDFIRYQVEKNEERLRNREQALRNKRQDDKS